MTEAKAAADHWGATLTRPLRLRENEVYEISFSGERAALRLHRVGYQSEQSIRSELWWCVRLGEMGLPVAKPVQALNGDILVQLESGRFASVVSWVDGEPLGEAGVPLRGSKAELADRHHALGKLLAKIHQATDKLSLPDWFERPAWDLDGFVGEAPLWGRFWDHPGLSADAREILSAARNWLCERLNATKSPRGLIHADVLRENVFTNKHSLSIIDFDDSGFGYRWYDLGTVLSQDLYEPFYPELRAALIDGYGQHLPVEPADVDAFTLARTLASVGWASTRLSLDHPVQTSHIARAVMMSKRLLAA